MWRPQSHGRLSFLDCLALLSNIMADPTTIAESIEQAAIAGVQSVSVDGVSTTGMSIEERIKADQFAKSQTSASKNHFGFRFAQSKPQCTQ